jgi:histidinol-phosphate aminotransferase
MTSTRPTTSHDLSAIVREELGKLQRYEIPHPENIRVRLDANESPYPLPAELQAALGAHLARVPLHRYPDGDARELRAVISRHVGVPGAQLVFGNGSDELISLLIQAFARPRINAPDGRARIAYPWPSFVVYRIATLAAGAAPAEIALDDEFQLHGRAIDAAFAQGKPNLVFFARPNNPTGTLWSRELVVRVAEEYPDVLVVSDEAYFDYAGETLLPQQAHLPNLVVMRTLSKIGLAALRCGYLIAHPSVVHELEKIRPPYNLGTLNQAAATFLVGEHASVLGEHIAHVVSERERLHAALAQVPGVKAFPSRANLLCFRVGTAGDGRATETWKKLAARGVLVRNFDRPGPLSGCLRVTVGTPAENDAFLEALQS